MRRMPIVGLVVVLTGAAAACGDRSESNTAAIPPTTIAAASAPTTTIPPTTTNAPTTTIPPTTTPPATTILPDTTTTTIEGPVVRDGANVSPDAPVGDPLSISIPSIGVESALVPAGYADDGTVAVPPDPNIAGYFTGGPRPGERGPAVIMGHVDSKKTGPGVFWHLRDLAVGSTVTVQTTTGALQFVVQAVEQYPKNAFPTERVYGPVPEPALRLITCGGSFDRSIGHYRDNIIAFLVPAASA